MKSEAPEDVKTDSGSIAEVITECDEKQETTATAAFPPDEWLQRLKADYTGRHDGGSETLPPGCDPDRMASAVLTLNEEDAAQTLRDLLKSQADDFTIDRRMVDRIRQLVQGYKACDMEHDDWAYELCKLAGLCHNWSPYAEVRAVTLPYDDADEPCETFRAYLLGFFWVIVCTAINTCKLRSLAAAAIGRLHLHPVSTDMSTDMSRLTHAACSLCSPPAGHLHPGVGGSDLADAHGPRHRGSIA
ncbi:hypothetical protein F5Y18DRAFT_377615 [Xylariaceae sp. FL1019]|nr:hypothetical protein F5Y18DRAFT_377615 [Xylariaceae sp. FL1019]